MAEMWGRYGRARLASLAQGRARAEQQPRARERLQGQPAGPWVEQAELGWAQAAVVGVGERRLAQRALTRAQRPRATGLVEAALALLPAAAQPRRLDAHEPVQRARVDERERRHHRRRARDAAEALREEAAASERLEVLQRVGLHKGPLLDGLGVALLGQGDAHSLQPLQHRDERAYLVLLEHLRLLE